MDMQLRDRLAQALKQAEARQFQSALATIKAAKATEPTNVNILALEKQLIKIAEFTDTNSLSEDESAETLELLRVLVDRARLRGDLRDLPLKQRGPSNAGIVAPDLVTHRREQTKEILRKQYLSRADQCVTKGDYDGALLEVHRVFLLDPDNSVAREYEARIRQLKEAGSEEPMATVRSDQQPTPKFFDDLDGVDVAELQLLPPGVELPVTAEEEQPITKTTGQAEELPRHARKLTAAGLLILILLSAAAAWHWLLKPTEVPRQEPAKQETSATRNQQTAQPTGASVQESVPAITGSVRREPTPLPTLVPSTKTPGKSGTSVEESKKPADHMDSPPGADGIAQEANHLAMIPETIAKTEITTSGATTSRLSDVPLSLEPIQPSPIQRRSLENTNPGAQSPFIPIEALPKVVRLTNPKFSDAVLRTDVEDQVVLEVQISEAGKPLQARVVRSTNASLNQPVMDAIMASEFSPGMMSTGPVTTWATIPFKFKR